MLEIGLVVFFAFPAAVIGLILLDLFKDGVDEAATRLSRWPEVSRRLPRHRVVRKVGVVLCALAVLPVAAGLKGSANAHQWRQVGVLSGAVLILGVALLGVWWFLAGRRVDLDACRD